MTTIKHISEKERDRELMYAKIRLRGLKQALSDNRTFSRALGAKDLMFIVDNYGKLTHEEIAKKVGRCKASISTILKWLNLTTVYMDGDGTTLNNLYKCLTGLNINNYSKYLFKKYGFEFNGGNCQVVAFDYFYKWYKKNLKLLNIRNYKIGTFPNEPDWFIEKANADRRAYEYTNKRIWTVDEDAILLKLVTERKTYKEISQTLKRTGAAIKRRCYDLGIQKPKRTPPKFWTEKQKEVLKTLWLKGYEPCIIAEEIVRSDREIISYLERYKYFGFPPQKFKTPL